MQQIGNLSIEALVDGLKSIPESEFTNENVADFLRGNLVAPESLQPYIHFQPEFYTRNLIFRNDLFELLLLCWERGQASPIHNHSGQHCWMSVQQGSLRITNFHEKRLEAGTNGAGHGERRAVLEEVSRVDRAGVGVVDHVDDLTYIHRIANPAEFGERAMSLHIYSRPFDSCEIYDFERQTARPIRLFYHTIHGHPAN